MYIVTVQIYSCARDGNLVRASQRNLGARGKLLIWGPIFFPKGKGGGNALYFITLLCLSPDGLKVPTQLEILLLGIDWLLGNRLGVGVGAPQLFKSRNKGNNHPPPTSPPPKKTKKTKKKQSE